MFSLRVDRARSAVRAAADLERVPAKLFFPTVHVHDGGGWDESVAPAMLFMSADQARGTVDVNKLVYRRALRGTLPNRDQWLA